MNAVNEPSPVSTPATPRAPAPTRGWADRLDEPAFGALWRIFCPRCGHLTLEASCKRCGWQRPTRSNPVVRFQAGAAVALTSSGATTIGDALYLTTAAGQVIVLDRFSLQERRRTTLLLHGQSLLGSSQVAADDTRLFVGGPHADLLVLGREDLSLLWTWPTAGNKLSSPAYRDGVVYFAASNNDNREAWAVDVESRRLLWRQPLPSTWSSEAPAVDDELVLFPSRSNRLLALRRRDGAPAWPAPFQTTGEEPAWLEQTPLLAGERVYVAGWDGFLTCLERRSGRLLWRYPAEPAGEFFTTPVQAGSLVLVGCRDHRIHVVHDWGDRWELAWSHDTGRRIYSRPLVIQDEVYVAGDDKRLHALDLASGQPLWPAPWNLDEHVRAPLATDGVQIIAVGDHGTVWTTARARCAVSPAARDTTPAARDYERAAQILEQQDDLAEALRLYRLANTGSSLNQALRLAYDLGDWRQEAEVLEALNRPREAGERVRTQARQQELATRGQAEEELAALFELALHYLLKAGLDDDDPTRRDCEQKVCYYRCLPDLRVYPEPGDRSFVVGQQNRVHVLVKNVGRGQAQAIQMRLEPAMEAAQGELVASKANLRARNEDWHPSLNLIPTRPGQIELRCRLEYHDKDGRTFTCSQRWDIEVQAPGHQGAPVIHVHEGGQVVLSARDTNIITGDLLQDQAQKGDRAVIERWSVERPSSGDIPRCRICTTILAAGAAFCDKCGEPAFEG